MPTQQKFRCDQCGMAFPSDESLFKHKTRFCIGVKDSGINRHPVYSDDEDYVNQSKRTITQKVVQHQTPIEKKREEIQDWKNQRSILQTVEDMEDHILTDNYRTEKSKTHVKKQDRVYSDILLEYERLQDQERDLLRQMYDLQIELPQLPPPPPPVPITIEVKQPVERIENRKGLFEDLQRRNLRLERERFVIQQKLEELIANNYQPSIMANYEPYRFLREMKEQHELNEKALNFLRGRLIYSDSSDIPTLPYINTRYTKYRRNGGDTMRQFRNNYLQSGGHDASVIARYTDIENRLRAYENYPWTTDYPEPLKSNRHVPDPNPIDPKIEQIKILNAENRRLKLAEEENFHLKHANNENQRLQHELHEMQRKFDFLNTRTKQLELSLVASETERHRPVPPKRQPPPSPPPSPPPQPSARDDDQFEQRPNFHQPSVPLLDNKRVTSRASPAMSLLTSNMNRLRDPLAPHPYDPIGGFVIFFDFLVNLPLNTDQSCLISCLYHPKSGLGEPSQLEPFQCEQYVDERSGERLKVALIATKQPVPRCPPQQALTVVIEVQTIPVKAPANEELKTTCWTKLPLFDNKNRLLSGRWKVPLKALPIHHDESLAIISTYPTYEKAELHYRLVNAQDSEDQSNAPLSPSFRDLYIYPLQYRQ